MKHLGMSTKQTGIIWTLERIVAVLSPPFVGAITDKTRRPKAVLVTLLLGGAVTLSSMYFVPQEDYLPSELGRSITADGEVSSDLHQYVLTFFDRFLFH